MQKVLLQDEQWHRLPADVLQIIGKMPMPLASQR
jgi:hypothetical protein